MLTVLFIVVLVVGIFAYDFAKRWWAENEWKRRLRRPPE